MKILSVLLFLVSFSAQAFTDAEKTQLRTAAQAEPSIATCISQGNDVCVADWFNTPSTFVAWRTVLNERDIYADPGFNFTLYDGLTQGKRDEWVLLLKENSCDPSKSNIRNGIIDVWSGTAAKVLVQDAIFAIAKRFASNAEKILATGTGTTATPGVMTWEGTININDVSAIMRP